MTGRLFHRRQAGSGQVRNRILVAQITLALCQPGSTAICSPKIRSITPRNMTAIARWAHRMTRGAQGHGRSRGLGHRRRQALFGAQQYWLQVWREKAEENIKQADKDWDAVKNLAGPEIVGPPCAASPPTTKVALRDGGHLVAVGGQLARDASGNVVGKGDLGRRSSRSARMSTRASKPGVRRSRTSFLRSAMSNSPPNSTNMPICASAISARLRRKARWSPCRNRPAPISWCRSKPSPRPRNTAPLSRTVRCHGFDKSGLIRYIIVNFPFRRSSSAYTRTVLAVTLKFPCRFAAFQGIFASNCRQILPQRAS